jgi:hypothetical protein
MRKAIKNYEGLYEVDELGNVYGLDRVMQRDTVLKNGKSVTQNIKRQGRQLTNYKAKTGYYVVNLSNGKKSIQHYVHFLVAQAFIGNRNGRLTINHKDGNKLNNHISNLEYCTYAENNRHAVELGLNTFKVSDFAKKIKVSMICPKTNAILKTWDSIIEAERETKIRHIGCAAKGNRKTAGKFKWQYS